METEHDSAVRLRMERELHLVAIAEHLGGGHDVVNHGSGNPSQVLERLADLAGLRPALLFVGQLLEAAPAALIDVGAGSKDSQGRGRFKPCCAPFRVRTLDARQTDVEMVAGKAAIHEHDAPVMTRKPRPSQSEVHDLKL